MDTSILEVPENTEEHNGDDQLTRKQQFQGTVVKTTLAGAIVDIGKDNPGIVHISRLQKDPVNRVEDVVEVGQVVDVWVRRVDPKTGRVDLTMIEPLEMEWRDLKKGLVIKGKVTRVESFGAFVEIGAERPGLVHISELSNVYIKDTSEVVREGDEVEVKVIGVNRRKKRIRLSMKALEEKPSQVEQEERAPEESPPDEPVPTAMEIALREAMDRAQETSPEVQKNLPSQKPGGSDKLDDILSRTLKQKTSSPSNQ